MSASITRPLRARLDHVAVAVGDLGPAGDYWRGTVGAGLVGWERNDRFRSMQVRLAGGGKLELLAPAPGVAPEADFVRRFLDRFGVAIHHVTLKVPDLHAAVDAVRAQGLDVIDVDDTDTHWWEAFLRPSQVGGLVVQLAWTRGGDAQWAARLGHALEQPEDHAPRLLGPALSHSDLDAAARIWTLLGATVDRQDGRLVCRWPDSPLDVVVERDGGAGPRALRVAGALPVPPPDVAPPITTV